MYESDKKMKQNPINFQICKHITKEFLPISLKCSLINTIVLGCVYSISTLVGVYIRSVN